MNRFTTSPLTLTLACSLLFAGCGGSKSDPAPTPGTDVIADAPTTTIGAQGGRVTSGDGRAGCRPNSRAATRPSPAAAT